MLIPFLVSRQLICGAGKVLQTPRGAVYCLSQRAEHIWEGVSSATTRSRPIINTRDEPHADAERYRRLHVIVGDSNMAEPTTLLKVGATDLVLRMVEAGVVLRDLTLENPIRAIREISHDITGRRTVRLANGREISALDIQGEYYAKACDFADAPRARRARLGGRAGARPVGPHAQGGREHDHTGVDREIDWMVKLAMIERYREQARPHRCRRRGSPSSTSRTTTSTGAAGCTTCSSGAARCERVVRDLTVFQAKSVPPQNTRARLRGEFIRHAQDKRRDFTVDWVHLKLNDQAQRTVLCKDPFRSVDERVDKLIQSM